ncbi:MAG TPA: glycerol-3-phosphate acyltransferase [Thermoflexia bacterium]|jgi:glycerol-3-phosphate acyltransferase PlsY|nr:glycerol-3-phosphate acyltransferase [Thermoflexia bacterium]
MAWLGVLLCVGAYLLGAFPTAYVVGRLVKGVDIRRYGTGNVGASNVWNSIAPWAAVPVAAVDIGKAAFAAWLALGPFDLGYPWAVAVGLCAALGHAWSPYLRFTGGRGLASIIGTLLVVFPLGGLIQVGMMVLGFLIKNELLTTLTLLAMPLLSIAFGRPPAVTWGCVAMILLTAVKRVEANRTPLPSGRERWTVIWRRLWLDRDVSSHKEWLARRPSDGKE